MCGRLLIGGLLGGIILFAWSAISWMVLPWHMQTMHGFKDEAAIIQAVKANATETGVYFLPLQGQHADVTQVQAPGPMVVAAVSQEGMTSMVPSLIRGLIAAIIAALLVTWMVMRTNLGYLGRVGFIMIFAIAGSVFTHFAYWNWFHFAADFTLVEIADVLIAWFLAGLVIAAVARRNDAYRS